ncbi:hypothetical protein TcWFU_005339 [Taenia crassiceps]|uniref:C2H2-type domain-containing protein n=1 Tax=Taenia crassiceps TaxID=6207 RepID=A0ABR4Q4X1_9CEST
MSLSLPACWAFGLWLRCIKMCASRCHTCQADVEGTAMKDHLRSEWHIYNLKRGIASLAPLSESHFQKKQELLDSVVAGGLDNILRDKKSFRCESCRKTFNSNKSYENHVRSRQHMVRLREFVQKREEICELNVEDSKVNSVDDTDVETVSAEENFGQPLPVGACLFCSLSFVNCPKPESRVLRHMEEAHNFVLPFSDKLVDAHGLLTELGRLVGEEFACLGCGRRFIGRKRNRQKRSLSQLRQEALKAVRMHMIDKEHNFLYTGEDDPVVIALAVAEAAEEDGEGGQLPLIALVGGELYSQFYAPEVANRTVVLPDNAEAGEEVYEVRLPTGGLMGHRRYYQTVYRQNAGSYLFEAAKHRKQLALTMGNEGERRLPALKTRHGALAHRSYGALDVSCMEALTQLLSRIKLSKYDLKLGLNGNRVLRGHLRRQC